MDVNGCEWIRKIRFNCDKLTFDAAISHGELHVLEWLNRNGCLEDQFVCMRAVEFRQFDMLY
jgi:hypothetical protein